MNLLLLATKIIVVAIFLVMFLRGSRVIWGVGLLTVTSALLLDTFLSTFSRQEALDQLGFFFYVISGALFAGAAAWLWGMLRSLVSVRSQETRNSLGGQGATGHLPSWPATSSDGIDTAFDRQMLYEQIRSHFSPDDVLDLVFDLDLNEIDIVTLDQNVNQAILNIIDLAERHGQGGSLALAVERILRPIPDEHLPRREKLDASTPKTALRHFLIANYSLAELEQLASELDIDWELVAGGNKKARVRSLLLFLYRRNRVEELIERMRLPDAAAQG